MLKACEKIWYKNDMIKMQQDKSMTWIMCGVLTKPELEKKGQAAFWIFNDWMFNSISMRWIML